MKISTFIPSSHAAPIDGFGKVEEIPFLGKDAGDVQPRSNLNRARRRPKGPSASEAGASALSKYANRSGSAAMRFAAATYLAKSSPSARVL